MQHDSNQITQSARTRLRRWPTRAVRSVSPAAVAVTVSLLIGGAGFADAATGGTFLLGKANTETSTASLADSKGTPLALSAPAGKAPLAVNRNTMVKNLNAEYLGGMTATGLAETGGAGFSGPTGHQIALGAPAVVASTGKLPAGTYYVTATTYVTVATGSAVSCWIAKASATTNPLNQSNLAQAGEFTAAETAAPKLTAGNTLEEICDAGGSGSIAVDAGIIAIRVLSSSHP